jgi:hypothetical protein
MIQEEAKRDADLTTPSLRILKKIQIFQSDQARAQGWMQQPEAQRRSPAAMRLRRAAPLS